MVDKLELQIHRFAFWSSVAMVISAFVSFGLPLDVEGGAAATHADRVTWLREHRAMFVLAWINQIVAMASLTGAFAGFAWLVGRRSPLAGLLSGLVLLTSFIAFIIPKFMAVWTIPMLAEVSAADGVNQSLADALLLLLNVSAPFSLFTAFDYLGFWLYALFGLLVAPYLLHGRLWLKLSALSFAFYGLAYHAMAIAILAGAVATDDIESYALSVSLLLVVPPLLGLSGFRNSGGIAGSRTAAQS